MRFLAILTFALTALSIFAQNDPVILEVGDHKITKSEFLQIYLKNNPAPKYDQLSLDEYMDLFVKFQLKVAEAEALGHDTIPRLVQELDGYKKQLAAPYLIDSSKSEALVQEAYERYKTEIRASHILVKLAPEAQPQDTLNAYKRIMVLRNRIINGEKFEDVATSKGGSDDPSVQENKGDLGFFSVFQMVYSFEDVAYKTNVGEVSMPVRSKFGYHLVYVTDKRSARGTIKVAHIMVNCPSHLDNETLSSCKKKINEIYEKAIKGDDFESLAKTYSDDPSSNRRGGLLPDFGTGTLTRMVPEFENAAFDLKNNGDISKPIQTSYGYHIIKRIDWKPIASFEETKKELERKVGRDSRSLTTQNSFIAKLKKEYHFKDKSDKLIKYMIKEIDSSIYEAKWNSKDLSDKKYIFKINKEKINANEFYSFVENRQIGINKRNLESQLKDLYQTFEKERVLSYENGRLETKYPAYKALVDEYHDGIILYDIMSEKVWNKAIEDTNGLKQFFKTNQKKYQWGKRLDATVYECFSEDIAQKVHELILNDSISSANVIDIINQDSELNLNVKTNKFEQDKIAYLKGQDLEKGINKPYEFEGKFYVVDVTYFVEPGNKDLIEAKGLVTSDYQNHLESTWLDKLQKKYTITIHKEVLYSLKK
ncbi:MAG: peptidylprolyl isomerase [Crocinitomicaceae bacterium]